ncbi:MAG TPA: hypothetical protein VFW40_07430, partial [Capsulimonadaceae bacterium]|nr:hypothetical protein [Capsulimonadaceae bacterium]
MKTPKLLSLFAVLLCTVSFALPQMHRASARPVVPVSKPAPANRQKFDRTRFVPESELKSGQLGYALTVFHGTKIERFGVKILGVLSRVNNGEDLILIRVTSGPSVSRQANIAAGMSGSPVYIGNR